MWLSSQEILELVDTNSLNSTVEDTIRYHGQGLTSLPSETSVSWDADSFHITKIGAVRPLNVVGIKWLTTYRNNPTRGLPLYYAIMVLNDGPTGAPLSVMDGRLISDIRTGSVSAVAAKYLARSDSKTIGMIGAGNQARSHLNAMANIFSLSSVKVYDKNLDAMRTFISENQSRFTNLRFEECTGAKEAAKDADIIVVATIDNKPVFSADWVQDGSCIIGITGFRDLDPKLRSRADRFFVDDRSNALRLIRTNYGHLDIDENEVTGEIGEVVAGTVIGRTKESDVTLFTPTGLGIVDVAVAKLAFDRAKNTGRGVWVDL